MEQVKDKKFGGERPLFGLQDTRLDDIEITDGESGIKCCKNIVCTRSRFYGKYPWWHVDGSLISDCYFAPESRSAIWYSRDMVMRDTVIDGPKFFREMNNLSLERVKINDADETFWRVNGLRAKDVELCGGTYPFMFCRDVYVDGLRTDSFYVFQYCRNVEVHNAHITTRDALWECSDVTVYDSVLDGEYLGWHSRNLRLVRCHISGEQPLCYINGLILEDCTFDTGCDRVFEDCTDIRADIKGRISHIKNPVSGHIVADEIGSVTYDEFAKGHGCVIESRQPDQRNL